MQTNGTSFDHLISQIDRRLERIEDLLDRSITQQDAWHEKLNGRVSELEKKNAEIKGGWTVLTIVGGVAGTIGGFVSKWLG